MTLFEDTNPHPLKNLLAEIDNHSMVLPDFQRDFVWEPSATQELIVSIANNYPAGSILRVRDNDRVFAVREFQGAPSLGGANHTFLVLDGQQRLTSLYQAFFGVGEHRFYINLNDLMADSDFEEAIFNVRAKTRRAKKLDELETQAEELILPLSVIKSGAGGFFQWSNKVTHSLEAEKRVQMLDSLNKLHELWFQTIDDYNFPVVTLSSKTKPSALCTIFETLNRTGVKLSVFELLTARFWPDNIRLRELWEKACNDHSIINDFNVDPYYVLQAISLASRKNPSCKRSDVLNLESNDILKWWNDVVFGLARGLEILRDDCRVMLPKWLPYQTMLPPLAAVIARAGNLKDAEVGAQREKIKRWFWCAVFGQVYESAPNSKAAKDVMEMMEWFEKGNKPETVESFRFDPRILQDVTPRQRSVYRGAICLILSCGARDFHTQSTITTNLMTEQGIDDHHVFPAKYLERCGVTEAKRRDCILNRTLIDRTTNQIISDHPPSQYLSDIKNTADFPFEAVLNSHGLPAEPDSPLSNDDFASFLEWRQDWLWDRIKSVTGVAQAADLEDDKEVNRT